MSTFEKIYWKTAPGNKAFRKTREKTISTYFKYITDYFCQCCTFQF